MLNDQPGIRALRQIERWDPLAFILLAHGLTMAVAGQTEAPLAVSLIAGAIAVARLGMGWLTPRPIAGLSLAKSVMTLILAFIVVAIDGGTESPFFFWVLLILGWQGLGLHQSAFRKLGIVAVLGYVLVLIVTLDFSVASLLRGALLCAFAFVLALGRWILDRRETEVARLDDVVTAIINEAPFAVAVFDADRDTLLYANAAAHEMGIASRDTMAHLVLDDTSQPHRVTTLAELVVGAGFTHSPLRPYRHISSPQSAYRIGFHPRRADTAPPIVLVYGMTAEEHGTVAGPRE